MGYRYLSTSRGDGNIRPLMFAQPVFSIDTYLPREWTETGLFCLFSYTRNSVQYRYLSTSRGDGNIPDAKINITFFICIVTYLPREGPETLSPDTVCEKSIMYRYLSTSRGAGNPKSSGFSQMFPIVYPPIYLGRGRKLFVQFYILWILSIIDTYRAGNLSPIRMILATIPCLYSYLSTSREDGNHSTSSISIPGQSKYISLSPSVGAGNQDLVYVL